MPHKGYTPTKKHRANLAKAKRTYFERVRAAIALLPPPVKPKRERKAFVNPKTDTTPTPVPPSASEIRGLPVERWGLYSYNAEGRYYYKRDTALTAKAIPKLIKELALPFPLWAFVKSGHTEAECFLPIRIAEDAIPRLGHRFQKLKEPKKK